MKKKKKDEKALKPLYTARFKKHLKKITRHDCELKEEIKDVMHLLINKKPIPVKLKDHPLYGDYKNYRDCHVKPDLLLIYKVDSEKQEIIFAELGSHSELFG